MNGTAGGGVIIDSNHKLNNQGTIQIGNVSNVAGGRCCGQASPAESRSSGKIIVDEPFTPTDADNDGDLDGPFAIGSNRYGIRTNGAITGNMLITSTGTITVEGNNSFGILLGGPLTGNFIHRRQDQHPRQQHGRRAAGRRERQRPAGGRDQRPGRGCDCGPLDRQRRRRDGSPGQDRRHRLSLHNAAGRPSKLDADDLLQGGPAVSIEGNVTKGIIVAVPPKDNSTTDNDEDDDGIEDAKEGSAAIASFGSAAALRIGSAGAITIGATEGTGTGFGLIVDGGILRRRRLCRRRRQCACRSADWAAPSPSPTASA